MAFLTIWQRELACISSNLHAGWKTIQKFDPEVREVYVKHFIYRILFWVLTDITPKHLKRHLQSQNSVWFIKITGCFTHKQYLVRAKTRFHKKTRKPQTAHESCHSCYTPLSWLHPLLSHELGVMVLFVVFTIAEIFLRK